MELTLELACDGGLFLDNEDRASCEREETVHDMTPLLERRAPMARGVRPSVFAEGASPLAQTAAPAHVGP
jgi:hypothetical protein